MTTAVLTKIVNNLLICGEEQVVDKAVSKFQNSFTLGTIAHGPGLLRFFGLNITQHEDYSLSIDGDDKLCSIATAPMTHVRQRDTTDPLSLAQLKIFASINSASGWLGITASPFCGLISSMFQQSALTATVATLGNQSARLVKLQKLGTLSYYLRPDDNLSHYPAIFFFCDAGRSTDSGQLFHICRLLIDDLVRGSKFHVISWSSHKAQRPVRSTGAAETLAASEGIEVVKIIASVYGLWLCMDIDLTIFVDSKDLYPAFTTQCQSIDRSIRGDIGVIRFEFEVRNVSRIIWIPGKLHIADIETKFDSPLVDVANQMLSSGLIPFSIHTHESQSSDRSVGQFLVISPLQEG